MLIFFVIELLRVLIIRLYILSHFRYNHAPGDFKMRVSIHDCSLLRHEGEILAREIRVTQNNQHSLLIGVNSVGQTIDQFTGLL